MSVDLLTRKVLRELRRSAAQTAALVGVLALGVAVFTAGIGAYRDLEASEARTFDALRFADAWFELEPTDAGIVDEILARPGIEAAVGRLVVDTALPVDGGDRVRSRLIGLPTGERTVNDVAPVDGSAELAPGTALVERHFAEARGIEPGDTVAPIVRGHPLDLEVVGVVASPEYLQVTPDRYELLPAPSTFGVLFVDLDRLQQVTDQQGLVNDLTVRAADGPSGRAAIDALEEDLRAAGGVLDAFRRADQATYAALQQDLGAFRSVAVSIPSLILVAGVVSVAVLLGRLVRTQRPLIGVLKAIGCSDRAVLRHYLTFALVIGTAGVILGIVAGTALGALMTGGYAAELGIPFTRTRFHPGVAALAAVVTLVAVALAGLRPAWQSARIAPAAATRVDVSATGPSGRTRLERILPMPLQLRLPLRAITRARSRALATGCGIVAAFALILMVLGMRDGINLFVQRTFDDVERWDVAVTFSEPQPASVAASASELEGVVGAAPYLQLPALVESPDGEEGVLLTAIDPAQDLRTFRLGGTSPTEAFADGSVVLASGLAKSLGVGPGDEVALQTPAGTTTLKVGGTTDEPLPVRAYVSLATAAQVAGSTEPPINGLYLRVEPGAASEVRSALFDLPAVESVKLRSEQRNDIESLLAIFTAIIAIMLVFAIAMAFALVFNAMTINILEREREYGTMRAIGAQPALITRLLLVEAATLWTLALVPGSLLGTWLARRLGTAVAGGLFELPIEISAGSYISTAIGLLGVVVIGVVVPMRRVRRLDLPSATKTLA